jgi:2-hydroxychromene-2-carboxylate isomerase
MGDLIDLDQRRADRARASSDSRPAFFFDLSSPLSYLVSERIEKTLGHARWIPVAFEPAPGPGGDHELATLRDHVESRARTLRLPLVWPDRFPTQAICALRAAAHACEIGAGERFALAASRLAFCGGFDLDDPETLAEAAAAAGVPLDDCLQAAADADRDLALRATANGLRSHGITEPPAFAIGRHWFGGESGLPAACAMLDRPAGYGRPLAPVG